MLKLDCISQFFAMLQYRLEKFSIFVGLRPFVFLGNIAGIFPCKYVNKRVRPGGTIRRCYTFGFFAIRMYVVIGTTSLSNCDTMEIEIAVIFVLGLITLFLAMLSDFFLSAFHQNRFVRFFDKLAMYDERVAKLGYPHQDRYGIYWSFLCVFSVFTYDVVMFDDEEHMTWKLRVWITMYIISLALIFRLSLLRFHMFVHLMYQRFRHFNKSILPRVSWTRKLSPPNMNFIAASDVQFLHATLVDASRITNGSFSFILLCAFSSLFFATVQDCYSISSQNSANISIPYVLSVFIAIIITCTVCHITAEEANKAKKYMVKDEPTLIEDSIAMDRVRMQLYLLHNRVMFSAGGFFEINLSIFYSMIVSILTYAVLLTKSSQRSLVSSDTSSSQNGTFESQTTVT